MTAPACLPAPGRTPLGLYARSSDRRGVHTRGGRGVRYRVQEAVQHLLHAPGLPRELQNRICTCHYSRRSAEVEVRQNQVTGRCHYRGLETCLNVWACPVCNGAITEKRREELQRAVSAWKEQGGECYLVTLTFPHQRSDRIADLLALMRRAADRFNTSKTVRAVRERAGYEGHVRALEPTWGSWHGWHPHFHMLYFCAPGQRAVLEEMRPAWIEAVIKTGLADRSKLNDMLRGADGESPAFDVQNGDYAAEYIAKYGHEPSLQSKIETGETWGIAREMVKGMSKNGRRLSGVTPMTLAAVYAGVAELPGMKRGRAGALFSEFALAFKGQRQLYWSPGLRKRLNMGRLFTDAELAELDDKRPEEVTVCRLNKDEWDLVKSRSARDEVLREVELWGADGLKALLDQLRARPPTQRPRHSSLDESPGVFPRLVNVFCTTPDGRRHLAP